MNKDKEPLMSAEEWLKFKYENYKPSLRECLDNQEYANYVTQWHLNNVKEVVCEEVEMEYDEGSDPNGIAIDKQSIANAVEKYIEDWL